MTTLLLCSAIGLLTVAHYFKMLRWKQFVEVYEYVGRKLLIRSMTYGYLVNFIVPFRIGDLIRAYYAGKNMKSGIAFSFATVVVDRCLDIMIVGVLFVVMPFMGIANMPALNSVVFYAISAGLLFLLWLFAIKYSKYFKRLAKSVCSIFNAQIELNLLAFLWAGITAIKDMTKRLNKKTLLLNTLLMWTFYLFSYYVMSLFISEVVYKASFFEVFSMLFGSGHIYASTISQAFRMGGNMLLMMSIYILIPLLMLLLISLVPSQLVQSINKLSGKSNSTMAVLHLLPQVKPEDKLKFLESYFDSENRDYLDKYINLNRDIRILQDYSAGSNATTMLCMDTKQTFYRKYAFGKDGDKLYEQLAWLDSHQGDIPLPDVIKSQRGGGYCCYDMVYDAAAVGLFNYLHSTSTEKCWYLLEQALEDLSLHIHQKNVRKAGPQTIEKYIEEKVWSNVKKIEASKEIAPLLDYDTLIINGKEYRSFKKLKKWLQKTYLTEVFARDNYADIHGDLTIENIICWTKTSETPYYFIDPNTGNIHESPFLDYGKLLQSLHGGYEFIMRTSKVDVNENNINFLFTCSQSYKEVFELYKEYLERKFTAKQVRSIFFHEVVHWLRLMPYKIEKNGKRAILFFAGLIIVFNETIDWFGEMDDEN